MGKNAMLSLLRQRYWILGARTSIKGIVSKCVICRKYKASPAEQKMADIPEEHLKPDLGIISKFIDAPKDESI